MQGPLDPMSDFRDDGGTPAWRANQAAYGRVIDVSRPGLIGWLRRTPTQKLMLYVLVVSFGLPWLVIIGGILAAFSFDMLTGR